jgi:hypothetical protein
MSHFKPYVRDLALAGSLMTLDEILIFQRFRESRDLHRVRISPPMFIVWTLSPEFINRNSKRGKIGIWKNL